LLDVAHAGDGPRLLARLSEHREQNSRQYSDNGDDDEQLNQRKTFLRTAFHTLAPFLIRALSGGIVISTLDESRTVNAQGCRQKNMLVSRGRPSLDPLQQQVGGAHPDQFKGL